jgi:hypothetical protein
MPGNYRVWIADQTTGTAYFFELRGKQAEKARRMAREGDYDRIAEWLLFNENVGTIVFQRKFDCEIEFTG